MVLKPFIVNKGVVLPHVDLGAEVTLEITDIGKVPWANLILISIATLSLDFILRVIVKEGHLLQRALFATVDLLKKAVELTCIF